LSSISGRLDVLKLIFEISRQQQIPLSWNPGKGELTLLANGDLSVSDISAQIMILNESEWARVELQQPALLQRIPEIVITDGKQGGRVFVSGSNHLKYEAQAAATIDDTGAGDAFSVGYVSARLAEHDPDVAVSWGVRNAASVVEHFGAKPGLLTKNQVSHSES
jgi:sugar/nucleoside kinase (ribokinase family)